MNESSQVRQALESVRRTRFTPQSRSERVALVSDAIALAVPYRNSAWLFLDDQGGLQDCITYPHCYPELQRIYASELHDAPTKTGLLPWQTLFRISGVFDLGELTFGLFFQSEFYRRCMVPAGIHDSLSIALRNETGRPYGFLSIARAVGQKFSSRDKRVFGEMQSDIGRACAKNLLDQPQATDFVIEEEGMLIINDEAQLQQADAPGRRLLWLASHPYLDREQSLHQEEQAIVSKLVDLAREAIRLGDQGVLRSPILRITHDRGQYDFRVHLLDPERGVYGVACWRSASRIARIARRLMGLRAGPRQKDIAILLARGLSYPEISVELGVAVSSVVTQVRLLFQKFDVSSREELVIALDRGMVEFD